MDIFLMSILQIGSGLFWSITYILIIRQGFRDNASGMPMAALCANISWEFIFSFIYPQEGLQLIVNIIWFALDFIILCQFLRYGRKEFNKTCLDVLFCPVFLLTLALSFSIIIVSVKEFNDLQGKYAAFSENLMMSILFIVLLFKRGNTKGQSFYIALFKMVGSILPAVGFFVYYKSSLINVLSAGTFLFDLAYIVLLYHWSHDKRGHMSIINRISYK